MERPVPGKTPRKASILCRLRIVARGEGGRQQHLVPLISRGGVDKCCQRRRCTQPRSWNSESQLLEQRVGWTQGVDVIAPARSEAYLCRSVGCEKAYDQGVTGKSVPDSGTDFARIARDSGQ